MKKISLVMLMGLAGCAGPTYDPTYQADWKPAPPAGEVRAAHEELARCHLRAAQELDDKRSDAATIARAVDTQCGTASMRLLDLRTRGISAYERRDLEASWPAFTRDAALKMVLRVRARQP